MYDIFITLLSLHIGSFANVCIYRWPRNGNIFQPHRSYCPWCRHQIRWFENIPVLSYIFLRGRCGHCGSPISIQYPLVELLMFGGWMSVWIPLRNTNVLTPIFTTLIFIFLFSLIVTTFTDLEWKLIPDQASLLLAAGGLILAAWNPLLGQEPLSRLGHAVLGLASAGAGLMGISLVGKWFFSKEVLGGGDTKLMAGIGAVLGWEGAIAAFVIASIVGSTVSVLGIIFKILKRHQYIPFGPFINLGAYFVFILKITGRWPSLY